MNENDQPPKIEGAKPVLKLNGVAHKLIRFDVKERRLVLRSKRGKLSNHQIEDLPEDALAGLVKLIPVLMGEDRAKKGDALWLNDAMTAALEKCPENHAVLIVTAPMGESKEGMRYVANCEREGAVEMLKTLLFQWGEQGNWAEHIR